jgi:hypothetical protein
VGIAPRRGSVGDRAPGGQKSRPPPYPECILNGSAVTESINVLVDADAGLSIIVGAVSRIVLKWTVLSNEMLDRSSPSIDLPAQRDGARVGIGSRFTRLARSVAKEEAMSRLANRLQSLPERLREWVPLTLVGSSYCLT